MLRGGQKNGVLDAGNLFVIKMLFLLPQQAYQIEH